MFKADGSFLVHDDVGGYRPLNGSRREFRPGAPPVLLDEALTGTA
jgi:hypothetical protein